MTRVSEQVIYSSYVIQKSVIAGDEWFDWYVPGGSVSSSREFRSFEAADNDARAAFGL